MVTKQEEEEKCQTNERDTMKNSRGEQ